MIDKNLVKELYKQGYGYTNIGNRLGVSKQRIHQIINNYHNTGKKNRENFYINWGRCSECDNPAEVLHHKDFNNENDIMDNLQPLCFMCHSKKHKNRHYDTDHRENKASNTTAIEWLPNLLRLWEDMK